MALLIPPGFAQASLRWSLTGDPEVMISTVGIGVNGPGQTEADDLADAWIASWPAANMFSQYTFLGVVLRVGQDGGPPIIVEAPRSQVGTATGNPLPQNCTVLVRKSTSTGGRSGRGRMYLPPYGLSESFVDSKGMIEPATVAVLQTAVSAALFGTVDPVLLHDEASPVTAPSPLSAVTVDTRIATQRRRLRP